MSICDIFISRIYGVATSAGKWFVSIPADRDQCRITVHLSIDEDGDHTSKEDDEKDAAGPVSAVTICNVTVLHIIFVVFLPSLVGSNILFILFRHVLVFFSIGAALTYFVHAVALRH